MNRRSFYFLFFLTCLVIAAGGIATRKLVESLPAVSTLEDYLPHLTTRVYDYKGNVLSELFTERRTWIPLNEIPTDLQNAFLSIEDDQFYSHWGISPTGMARATIKNFLAGRAVQGGSTITQQLSKLIFLTQEKTLARKFRELLLSLQIERRFSKEEIFQMYLNQVYFGHGAYGVAAAAKTFFGKRVQDLNLSECALLAGLPRLPQYYSPFNHKERALGRRATVLARMAELEHISPAEKDLANRVPLQMKRTPYSSATAPYFIEYLRQILEPKYGSDLLYRGGLSIHTTLDLKMQESAEKIFSESLEQFDKEYGATAELLRVKEKIAELKKSGAAPSAFNIKPSTTIPEVQGALIAIEPRTGAIRALIGGRDFSESQFNRAIQSKRQPGSTFKPFVWLAALDSGLTAASIVPDVPTAFKNDGQNWRLIEGATDAFSIRQATADVPEDKVWVPKNYDGKYFGPMTLRKGLSFSRNIVSIRLIDRLGAPKVAEWAQKCGIKSPLDAIHSLALGTSVTTLIELTSALGTFAAEGIHTEPYAIAKIVDFDGKVLEENFPQEKETVSPQLSYLMNHLLRTVVTEGTARSANVIPKFVAGKTGTSQDQRDLWFVGYTPDLICGAWMGYDDFSSLGKKMAASGILVPWWTEFMLAATKDVPSKDPVVPEGITFAKIDRQTGFLSLPTCPKVALEAFIAGTEPKEFCPLDHAERKESEMETEE
ncbi:MAG: PBP1A family penicillin-binding protein [Elusimicrobia bacterium]|nr:PBP1A family penicillin-binding protein [Elusimicrobiota bacterium]